MLWRDIHGERNYTENMQLRFPSFYSTLPPLPISACCSIRKVVHSCCQCCWIVKTSLCWLHDFGSFPTPIQLHPKLRRGLFHISRQQESKCLFIVYYVNEKSRQKFAAWLWVKLKKLFSHIYIDIRVSFIENLTIYHQFLLSQEVEKWSKKKIDQVN